MVIRNETLIISDYKLSKYLFHDEEIFVANLEDFVEGAGDEHGFAINILNEHTS